MKARLRRLWILAALLFGCATTPVQVQRRPDPDPPEKEKPYIEGNPGESPLHLLARLTLTICKNGRWNDADLLEAELKLTACLKDGHQTTQCTHKLCDDVWPEPEAL